MWRVMDYTPANNGLQSSAAPAPGLPAGIFQNSTAAMQHAAAGCMTGSPGHGTGLAVMASATNNTAGARNPFAAMPREIRNSQLRSNLLAAAGAFSSCPSGSSPSTSGISLTQPQQPQQMQWQPSVLAAAPAAAAGAAQPPLPPAPPTQYHPAASSNGLCGSGTLMHATPGPMGCSFGPQVAQQPCSNVVASTAMAANVRAVSSGLSYCSSPLPMALHQHQQRQQYASAATYGIDGSYSQQQVLVNMPQHQQLAGQHVAIYSDPLPYLSNVSTAPAQQQLVYLPQAITAAVPSTMLSLEQQPVVMHQAALRPAGQQQPPPPPRTATAAGVHPAGVVHMGGAEYSQVQQLLQKQQALQAMEQMVQQQLLRLLPDT